MKHQPGATGSALAPDRWGAEQSVIACILLDDGQTDVVAVAASEARPDHFTDPQLRRLFAAALALHQEGLRASMPAILQRAKADTDLADLAGELASSIGTTSSARHFARMVCDEGQRRQLATALRRCAAEAEAPGADVPEFAAQAREAAVDFLQAQVERQKSPFTSAADFLKRPAPRWLFPGIIPDAGLGVLVGPPGSGKSFLALDIAMCVATDRPLLQQTEWRPLRAGWVLVLLGESHASWAARLAVYLDYYGLDAPSNLVYAQQPPSLGDGAAWATFRQQIDGESKRRDAAPTLVVVDTIAACSPGIDENSARDMGLVMAHLQQLVAAGSCVIALHHPGKGGSYRGSTALLGSPDWMLNLKRDGATRTLEAEKLRDADQLADVSFELVKHGDSAILRKADAPSPAFMVDTTDQGLRRAIVRHGFRLPGDPGASGGLQTPSGICLREIMATWEALAPIIPTRAEDRRQNDGARYRRQSTLVALVRRLLDCGAMQLVSGTVTIANTTAMRASLNAIVRQSSAD